MNPILGNIFGGLSKDVKGILDEVITNDEERLNATAKIDTIINDREKTSAENVSFRWDSDNRFGSKLSKLIRPLTLIFLSIVFVIISFMDGNAGDFNLNPVYVPVYQTLLLAVYGAYFVGRTIEKNNGTEK